MLSFTWLLPSKAVTYPFFHPFCFSQAFLDPILRKIISAKPTRAGQ